MPQSAAADGEGGVVAAHALQHASAIELLRACVLEPLRLQVRFSL